jgi:hypothetical protein
VLKERRRVGLAGFSARYEVLDGHAERSGYAVGLDSVRKTFAVYPVLECAETYPAMGSNPLLTGVPFINHPFDVIPKIFNVHAAIIGKKFTSKDENFY